MFVEIAVHSATICWCIYQSLVLAVEVYVFVFDQSHSNKIKWSVVWSLCTKYLMDWCLQVVENWHVQPCHTCQTFTSTGYHNVSLFSCKHLDWYFQKTISFFADILFVTVVCRVQVMPIVWCHYSHCYPVMATFKLSYYPCWLYSRRRG